MKTPRESLQTLDFDPRPETKRQKIDPTQDQDVKDFLSEFSSAVPDSGILR